jgi:hypothetical protein
VLSAALLGRWAELEWDNGVQIDSLLPLDTITVVTCYSRYEIVVVTPAEGRVLVRGGAFFPAFKPALVAGSTLGGHFLKQRGIYAGFHLELTTGEQRIITSRVRTIVTRPGHDAASIM